MTHKRDIERLLLNTANNCINIVVVSTKLILIGDSSGETSNCVAVRWVTLLRFMITDTYNPNLTTFQCNNADIAGVYTPIQVTRLPGLKVDLNFT